MQRQLLFHQVKTYLFGLSVLSLCGLFAYTGCIFVPTLTPTHSPIPTDTPIPTIPTATATPTPTPIPTNTLTPTPIPTNTPTPPPLPTHTPPPTPIPPTSTPALSPTSTSPPPFAPIPPPGLEFATLDEFWAGAAEWLLEEFDVGLPVGESDTIHRGGGEFWSYLHASHQSAGVVDKCGAPAPFPGCVTLWKSHDGGLHFALESPRCLLSCLACPCVPDRDHTHQQQYPRVFFDTDRVYMVYEWGAGIYMRTSTDGLNWSGEAHVPGTGQWNGSPERPCTEAERIGEHPNIYSETEYGNCLVGAPPGIYIEDNLLYVFVGLGRDPGHMGCYVGDKYAGAEGLRKCAANPLFGADAERGYGPLDLLGPEANSYFEFRTISSADVVRVGDRYYMAYEGVRGPSNPAVVDDQFALGFARSAGHRPIGADAPMGPAIDGPWEKYPGNPVIMDLANNWGIGHADVVIAGPATYLYTATSQTTRGRYVLVRR